MKGGSGLALPLWQGGSKAVRGTPFRGRFGWRGGGGGDGASGLFDGGGTTFPENLEPGPNFFWAFPRFHRSHAPIVRGPAGDFFRVRGAGRRGANKGGDRLTSPIRLDYAQLFSPARFRARVRDDGLFRRQQKKKTGWVLQGILDFFLRRGPPPAPDRGKGGATWGPIDFFFVFLGVRPHQTGPQAEPKGEWDFFLCFGILSAAQAVTLRE